MIYLTGGLNMVIVEETLPKSTIILFILDILGENNRDNLAIDYSEFFALIKEIDQNKIRIRYGKYYDDMDDGKLINNLLNRDIYELEDQGKIEVTPGNTIKIKDKGKEIVNLVRKFYNDVYERIEKVILDK